MRFVAGQLAAQGRELTVEVTDAEYGEQTRTLSFVVRNQANEPLVIARDGILLGVGTLEFPASTEAADAPDASTSVPPMGTLELTARFGVGRTVRDASTLRLRSLQRGSRWLDAIAIDVPPPSVGSAPAAG